MAIKLVKGEWFFDTAEEAAEFQRLSVTHTRNGHGGAKGELTAANLRLFLNGLKRNQKRLVRAMLSAKDVVADKDLRDALNLKNNKGIGGIMAGVSRRAKKSGFSIEALWSSETKYSDSGERSKQFQVSEAFRKLAKEIGELK